MSAGSRSKLQGSTIKAEKSRLVTCPTWRHTISRQFTFSIFSRFGFPLTTLFCSAPSSPAGGSTVTTGLNEFSQWRSCSTHNCLSLIYCSFWYGMENLTAGWQPLVMKSLSSKLLSPANEFLLSPDEANENHVSCYATVYILLQPITSYESEYNSFLFHCLYHVVIPRWFCVNG